MKPQGVHMAWVVVNDLKKEKEFFSQTLGLQLMDDEPESGWAEFSAGDGAVIGVAQENSTGPVKAGQNAVICIFVADIVAIKKELESKKARIIGDIIEIPNHVKILFIQDPSGNYYNIMQKLG